MPRLHELCLWAEGPDETHELFWLEGPEWHDFIGSIRLDLAGLPAGLQTLKVNCATCPVTLVATPSRCTCACLELPQWLSGAPMLCSCCLCDKKPLLRNDTILTLRLTMANAGAGPGRRHIDHCHTDAGAATERAAPGGIRCTAAGNALRPRIALHTFASAGGMCKPW